MRVRLTRRLADFIDGVNLSAHRVGDVFEVTRHEAELLIAEDWAVPVASQARSSRSSTALRISGATADDRRRVLIAQRRRVLTAEYVRGVQQQIQQRSFQPHPYRRAEDRIRDEWHDEHARVLNADAAAR